MNVPRVLRRISLYSVLASSVLFAVSITSLWMGPLPAMEANALYFARSMPATYWAGMGLLLIAVATVRPYPKIWPGVVVLVVLYVFGVQVFGFDNPRFLDTYNMGAGVQAVVGTGRIQSTWFADSGAFPGMYSFVASLVILTNVDVEVYMRLYPVVIVGLVMLFVLVQIRRLGQMWVFGCLALISASAWILEWHLSRQSLALLLYALLWFTIMRSIFTLDRVWRFLSILIYSSMIIIHPGTPLMVLGGFFIGGLAVRFADKILPALRGTKESLEISGIKLYAVPFSAIYLSWMFLNSERYLQMIWQPILEIISGSQSRSISITRGLMFGGNYEIVHILRIGVIIFAILLSLFLLIFARRHTSRSVSWSIVLVSSPILFGVFSFLLSENLYLERSFLFLSFGIAILIGGWDPRVTPKVRLLVYAFLAYGLLTTPLTRYGQEPSQYPMIPYIKGVEFVASIDFQTLPVHPNDAMYQWTLRNNPQATDSYSRFWPATDPKRVWSLFLSEPLVKIPRTDHTGRIWRGLMIDSIGLRFYAMSNQTRYHEILNYVYKNAEELSQVYCNNEVALLR